jgi:hypothetical protein
MYHELTGDQVGCKVCCLIEILHRCRNGAGHCKKLKPELEAQKVIRGPADEVKQLTSAYGVV